MPYVPPPGEPFRPTDTAPSDAPLGKETLEEADIPRRPAWLYAVAGAGGLGALWLAGGGVVFLTGIGMHRPPNAAVGLMPNPPAVVASATTPAGVGGADQVVLQASSTPQAPPTASTPAPTRAAATPPAPPQPTAAQQAVAACLVRGGISAAVALSHAMDAAASGAMLDACRANPAYVTPQQATCGPCTVTSGPQVVVSAPQTEPQGPGNPWWIKVAECLQVRLCRQ